MKIDITPTTGPIPIGIFTLLVVGSKRKLSRVPTYISSWRYFETMMGIMTAYQPFINDGNDKIMYVVIIARHHYIERHFCCTSFALPLKESSM